MKNQFVTYDLAKRLKEASFDDECLAIYDSAGRFVICEGYQNSTFDPKVPHLCTAPLYQQVIDWLREKHGIHAYVEPASLNYYRPELYELEGERFGAYEGHKHDTYPKAREAAILKALELIQQPSNQLKPTNP